MNYLLFAVYFIIFCWLLVRIPAIKKSGISSKTILALFFIKILAGIAIGWLSLHYYNTGNDYWDINRESWKEYQLLVTNPKEYFTNIFSSGYAHGYTGFFDSFQSFWNDLKNNLVIKLVSVFNIFSRGNYYINSLFFNFIIFFGHIALYRVFIKIYKGQVNAVIISCFLLPSMLYFSSGIHRDGIVFLMLAVLVFNIFESLQQQAFKLKRIITIVFALGILFLMRNFIFLALLPATIAWLVAVKMKWQALPTFLIVYLLAGLLLFNLNNFFPSVDPLKTIVQKQADFLSLAPSSTAIELDTLHPGFISFLKNTPQAFNHLFMRPYLTELPSNILVPMNIELFLYQLLFFILLLFYKKRTGSSADPFIYFAIFFTLNIFLFIGYIVPNLGALVRYRSLYLPFLITPLICSINWKKLKVLIKITN